MDTMEAMMPVTRGLKLYVEARKRITGKWNWRDAKVFCLTHFDTTHQQDMERILAIQECECWPYVMVYDKPTAPSITRRLQRWTNNAIADAASTDFEDYQRRSYKRVIYDWEQDKKETVDQWLDRLLK